LEKNCQVFLKSMYDKLTSFQYGNEHEQDTIDIYIKVKYTENKVIYLIVDMFHILIDLIFNIEITFRIKVRWNLPLRPLILYKLFP